MNDFERRVLDVVQSASYIDAVRRKDQKILAIDYFAYNVNIADVPAATGTGSGIIQVQSDSDFALVYMSAGVTDQVPAFVANPMALAQVTDTGSGKTFFSAPALFGLVFGGGGFPFLLPAPRVVAPNTNIKIDVSNFSAATVYDFYFSLMGARIYYA